jgi:glycosyltransferase involved in cell wall biosynthesis
MKRVLFLVCLSLKDAQRGTPLRTLHLLSELKKSHDVTLCVLDAEEPFVPYPTGSLWSRVKMICRLVKERNIDVIFFHTDNGMRVPVLVKWLTGVPLAIDLHGLAAEEALFFGQYGRFRKAWEDFQVKFFLRFYDRIFVVSEKLKQYYQQVNSAITVLHGGVALDEIPSSPVTSPEVFTIGYMGNARAYQGLSFLFDAAQRIKEKNLFPFRLNLVISRDGDLVREDLRRRGLFECADIHADVEHLEAQRLITDSTVLVIPRPSLAMTEYAFPSKLPEYLVTGIPVVLTDVGPVEELFHGAPLASVIPSTSIAEGLEQALEEVFRMSEADRRAMGQRAVAFVKTRLSWEFIGLEMNEAIEKLPVRNGDKNRFTASN